MHNLDLLLQAAIPVVALVAGLVLLAYHFALVRDAVHQLTALVEATLHELAATFERAASVMRRFLTVSTEHLTHNGRFPLPLLIVAVSVLTPVLFVIVVVEVRLWGGYFESLFPEQIDLPLIGTVSAGVLTALMPVAAGFLLGWMVDALFGAFPLPILGGAIGASARSRLQAVFGCVLLVLWVLLAVTVVDAANEVYDGLGDSTCALRAAGYADAPGANASDVVSSAVELSVSAQAESVAAQASCVADWRANDRARSIRIILGELALHLSALFAWSILAGAGLLMLVALAVPIVVLGLLRVITRLTARLAVGLGGLVEAVLNVLRAIGVLIVRALRWVGLPLPATDPPTAVAETEPAAAVVVTSAEGGAPVGESALLSARAPDAWISANGREHTSGVATG